MATLGGDLQALSRGSFQVTLANGIFREETSPFRISSCWADSVFPKDHFKLSGALRASPNPQGSAPRASVRVTLGPAGRGGGRFTGHACDTQHINPDWSARRASFPGLPAASLRAPERCSLHHMGQGPRNAVAPEFEWYSRTH